MLLRVHLKYCLVLPAYEEGLGGAGFLTGIDFGCVCCYFVCGSACQASEEIVHET